MVNVTIVMIHDIGLEIVLREQQKSTNKKPAYGQCYTCGLEDHWAPNCPKRKEDFTSQQSSVSTEKQQTESSVGTKKPSRKRKASEIDIFDFDINSDITPKRRRLDTRSKKTVIHGKKPYSFIVNQTLTRLDPVQRW